MKRIEVGMDGLYVTFDEVGMQVASIIKDEKGLSIVNYVVHEAGYEDISSDLHLARKDGETASAIVCKDGHFANYEFIFRNHNLAYIRKIHVSEDDMCSVTQYFAARVVDATRFKGGE